MRRGTSTIAVLNKFPYSSGHLLVAPIRHVGELASLTEEEALEVHAQAVASVDALGRVYGPAGFNLGWNLGRAAGAGIADHVHLHVVPRWHGDTNFMTSVSGTRVIPEDPEQSAARLRPHFLR